MKLNHFICPQCGYDFYAEGSYANCDACACFFYASQSRTCQPKQPLFGTNIGWKYPTFTGLLLVLMIGSGCAIRATESDVARWHVYSASERVPQFEGKETERCYSRKGAVRCFDLRTETDVSYEIDEKGCHQ